MNTCDFSELVGKTIVDIQGCKVRSDYIVFKCSDGSEYDMRHYQDCCESVDIDDVVGDPLDLIGTPILMADEAVNPPETSEAGNHYEPATWTFYKLATQNGYVTIKWMGVSNGYYSEDVDFTRTKNACINVVPLPN